jgi:hypothetical protein
MKNLILLFVVLLFPVVGWATHATGNDDSDTATGTANCNASFQEDCMVETTISSDAVAAPVGIIGGGSIETLVLIILLASTLKARIAKRRGETHLRTGARHQ